MEVVFASTFVDSLKKLTNRQRWYWKVYDLIRYDIPRFCSNAWHFRHALWNNYDFDSHGSLLFLRTCLELTLAAIERYGNEVPESRLKKTAMMRRAIEILGHHIDDDFIDLAEQQLGKQMVHKFSFKPLPDNPHGSAMIDEESDEEREQNREICNLSRKIEVDTWKELFTILHGQDYSEFSKLIENLTPEEKHDSNLWTNWFDGSGLKTWWD